MSNHDYSKFWNRQSVANSADQDQTAPLDLDQTAPPLGAV